MTDQLTPPKPTEDELSRVAKAKSEIMAGGAVTENLTEDELAGGWRGALSMLGIAALFAWLGFANFWIFVFVVGVVISIFLHELGHYLTARWTGMKVTQFFLFFGPRLWSFRRGETEYGVRAVPLGAFVRIIGMNRMDEVEPGDEARTYRQKSFPRRLLVISAGSIMHMLIAIVLLFGVYAIAGEESFSDGARVSQLSAGGPADGAGVLPGDIVVAVDGAAIDSPAELGEVIRTNQPDDSVVLGVLRNGELVALTLTLGVNDNGDALAGISSGSVFDTIDHSIPAAAGNAVTDIFPFAWESTKGVVKVLNPVNIISHVTGDNEDLSSRPTTLYGVAQVSDDVGESSGWAGMILLLAVLNVFVGVFNMFPLLPLDGGHAAIAVYERVREAGRGSKQRYFADVERLMPFAMGVVTVLVMLMFAGLYLDISQPL
ncbi:MAG: PDZ domain-containing protein [Ilumatobacter sp.]|jgi:membrane-associated protease RseP (regulator of RpoE activity)|uniref:M50 family metallopeptidase n=1 Tax=Ilumatobacter sp. TaxID=1967498 RepID=UPI001DD59526|nr:PDZ domain-containing protein [Ilumatobacter sp.]MBT5276175.1 PDZ domain-containing protein [Ilumatobacter sp.]MBT5552514.1 PDZ domain-containing protein [Ilumatobacter sp.]MBT5864563.1 PDZ domain-containing protein [Ilumatobacter sp.]MDG0977937.1 site-2 protease family protein [Ilumatobacter sp.]